MQNLPQNGANMRDYVDALNRALEAQLRQVRELVDQRVGAEHELTAEQFRSAATALTLASENMLRTLAEMNNIRDQLDAQRGSFVEQNEYEAKHEALRLRVTALESNTASSEAVNSYRRYVVGLAIGFVLLGAGVIANLILNLNGRHP